MIFKASSLAILVLVTTAAIAQSVPHKAFPVVQCVYNAFKATTAVKSIEVYAVGDFRFAVEYTFIGKDGRALVGDLMISGATYMVQAWHNESSADGFAELNFAMGTDFSSKCPVRPAADHLLPPPPPRPEWQRLSLSVP